MTNIELAEKLYERFWRRNTKTKEEYNKVDKFYETSNAIQQMWANIANDAMFILG